MLVDAHPMESAYKRGDEVVERDRWVVAADGRQMTMSNRDAHGRRTPEGRTRVPEAVITGRAQCFSPAEALSVPRPLRRPRSPRLRPGILTFEWVRIHGWAQRDGESVRSGAVSGECRSPSALSDASRRDRREHRGRSQCAAKTDPVLAGPLPFVSRFRGLFFCAHPGNRRPRTPSKPGGRSALVRGIQTSPGSGSA